MDSISGQLNDGGVAAQINYVQYSAPRHREQERSMGIGDQIELAFNPAEPRDKTGRWFHGTDVNPDTGRPTPPVRQFPISDVLAMESRDGPRVADTLAAKRTTQKYRDLLESMRRDGLQSPVDIYPGESPGAKMLADGHNRVAAAQDLGWPTIAGYDFTAKRRQADLSTCPGCGCLADQIELISDQL